MAHNAELRNNTTGDDAEDRWAGEAEADDRCGDAWPRRKAGRERRRRDRPACDKAPVRTRERTGVRRGPTRAARQGTEEFRCRHCRTFVGPTLGGGRHRNHCPTCLHSRHVDARRPGDRASDCRATMAPVARFDRPGGEPVLVHRCFGCGVERHNRLAADDDITLLPRLPLVAPRPGRVAAAAGPGAGGADKRGDESRRRSS